MKFLIGGAWIASAIKTFADTWNAYTGSYSRFPNKASDINLGKAFATSFPGSTLSAEAGVGSPNKKPAAAGAGGIFGGAINTVVKAVGSLIP